MENYGFVKVAAVSPALKVADCNYNTEQIIEAIKEAERNQIEAIVFPELSITSYTAQDLFLQRTLLDTALVSLLRIADYLKNSEIIVVVGLPIEIGNQLYNVAAILQKGNILGLVPKTYMPNYSEFYDKRWFSTSSELSVSSVNIKNKEIPIGKNIIFENTNFRFAIEICEDLWMPIPPSSLHSLKGADIIFNLSASPDTVGKNKYRQSLVAQQSARCIAGYVYASAGNGESTTDLVFSGSCIIAENGNLLAENKRFSFGTQMCIAEIDIERLRNSRLKNKSFTLSECLELKNIEYKYIQTSSVNYYKVNTIKKLCRIISPTPFIPSVETMEEKCSEIFSIQIGGLAKRLLHINCRNVVIGVSGGLDSTLALLVVVQTFKKLNLSKEGIWGITMPGFGTTDRTYNNAIKLMKSLGITTKEISIKAAVEQHFKDIGHDPTIHDTTYENSQARERTQILMDYANKVNGLVIGTGDLSELALGWCTYNGDHMSMYAVNTGIPKTLVSTLVKWIAENHMDNTSASILKDVLNTPVSPELLPATKDGKISQITEDTVGPYVLHDFFLHYMLGYGFEPQKIYFLATIAFKSKYSDNIILQWLKVFYRRFFSQQFKRSCLPDGPKVGSINLSPRGDWRMPSDASATMWLQQLDTMQ